MLLKDSDLPLDHITIISIEQTIASYHNGYTQWPDRFAVGGSYILTATRKVANDKKSTLRIRRWLSRKICSAYSRLHGLPYCTGIDQQDNTSGTLV